MDDAYIERVRWRDPSVIDVVVAVVFSLVVVTSFAMERDAPTRLPPRAAAPKADAPTAWLRQFCKEQGFEIADDCD